jgi:transposase-like protein
MSKKTRKKFTKEERDQAVADYLSGEKTAPQIAKELDTDVQNIYRWKTVQGERKKGLRIDELMADGNSKETAKKLLEKELEIEMYQKKIAEQSIIIDLLKKLQTPEDYQPESELTGLIRTTRKSVQKRKQLKR